MKLCFKVSNSHTNSFSASWTSKKGLGQARLSDVLSGRRGLTTHYLHFERLKERPFERISYILGIQKSDSDEVAEEMFYVGELA
jgi:hypothetical protein